MRLIDADALKERAIRVSTVKEHCYMKAVGTHEIDKAPTIDAVPVVRCKDCKAFVRNSEVDTDRGDCYRYGLGCIRIKKIDDFCSYGERRNNG